MLKLVLYVGFTLVMGASLIVSLRRGSFTYRGMSGSRTDSPIRFWGWMAFLAAATLLGVFGTIGMAREVLAI